MPYLTPYINPYITHYDLIQYINPLNLLTGTCEYIHSYYLSITNYIIDINNAACDYIDSNYNNIWEDNIEQKENIESNNIERGDIVNDMLYDITKNIKYKKE